MPSQSHSWGHRCPGSNPYCVKVVIENLLYFADVKEAVETLGKEQCGFKPSATFEKASDLFLSNENFETIEKFGIVAIVFKLLEQQKFKKFVNFLKNFVKMLDK